MEWNHCSGVTELFLPLDYCQFCSVHVRDCKLNKWAQCPNGTAVKKGILSHPSQYEGITVHP